MLSVGLQPLEAHLFYRHYRSEENDIVHCDTIMDFFPCALRASIGGHSFPADILVIQLLAFDRPSREQSPMLTQSLEGKAAPLDAAYWAVFAMLL